MTCQIRTHSECSCNPGECKTIHLGTFHKREQEAIQNTFPPAELIVVAVTMFAICFGFGWLL